MTGSLSVAPRGPVWSLYLLALGDHFTTKAQTVTMEGNCYQLRVQLSAKGKRVVKGRYSDPVRNPYGSKRHKYGETMENCSNQKYHKLKNLWFRITIPYGRKYDKMWLLSSIEHECGFHFQALQFRYVNHMATFFVDNFSIARSLVQASKKIQGEQFHKIIIKAEPFYSPNEQMDMSILSPLDSVNYLDHSAEHIQSCLWKRYNQVFQSLDLSDLGNDPDLLSANVFFSVNNASATEVVLQIISEYYPQLLSLNLSHNNLTKLTGFAHLFYLTPQLQSLNLSYNKLCKVQDLDLIHNLELRELWLKGNPLHGAVESFSAYYRLITYHFPAIEKLDGRLFKENLYFEQEEPKPLPESKGSFFGSDEIKTYLAKFLHQYFTLYDSGERKTLLPLYHENACCSFSLPNVFYPRICFLRIKEYWKENRNLLRVRRPEVRRQLIKYNRLQVVGFLCNLPNTEHDLPSMTLDVSLQTASIMCFTVEVHTSCHKTPFIPFRRTFIIVPAAEDSAQILNDQMVILNTYVSPQETSSGLSPKSAPAICKQSPPPAAGDTAASFSKDTGMKLDWALKCLQDNNWDVQQAMEMFHVLKNRGAIPQEAFEVETAAGDTSG
ncbi:nuclear RNA export factor 1-like isoform X2 [Hyla sarda]|uniref:nuclear RNA export factor 1-like isoform X2 n=1 Tax=Hyla sarda TaxID=327740 RepID=UPI0024C31CF0|nr:nuclear RNA export factor 1-like isoform X2 [Hyla sarda]